MEQDERMNEYFMNKRNQIRINIQKVFLKLNLHAFYFRKTWKNYPEFTFREQSIHSFFTHAFVRCRYPHNPRSYITTRPAAGSTGSGNFTYILPETAQGSLLVPAGVIVAKSRVAPPSLKVAMTASMEFALIPERDVPSIPDRTSLSI